MKRFNLFVTLVCLLFFSLLTGLYPAKAVVSKSEKITVLLSSPNDPYYPLAEEISAAEGIPIYHSLAEAAAVRPVFLLWVAVPYSFSEEVLLDFSREIKALDVSISTGILTGSSLSEARGLWRGAVQVPAEETLIANGTKQGKVDPELIFTSGDQSVSQMLSKEDLLSGLAKADAAQISLEGAADVWFEEPLEITISAADLPGLDGKIIQHYGCSSFRPWAVNSIALGCINRGAAAYSGFLFPSISGSRFGDYTEFSYVNTWEKFPLGHLILIQNRTAMQVYADSGHYFLLGDPRIYSQAQQPYTISSDEVSGDRRTLQLRDVPAGLVPVFIEDGAGYDYVNVPDLTFTTQKSIWFNSLLQMIEINADKYVLLNNPQAGDLQIELRKNTPILQTFAQGIQNFGDKILAQNQAVGLLPVLYALVLVLLLVGYLRKRYTLRQALNGLAVGIVLALLFIFYSFLRKDKLLITNIPVSINWFYAPGIPLFTLYGWLRFQQAKKPLGKALSVLWANLNSLATLLLFGVGTVIPRLVVGNHSGINKIGFPSTFVLLELLARLAAVLYNLFTDGKKNKKAEKYFCPGLSEHRRKDFETGKLCQKMPF